MCCPLDNCSTWWRRESKILPIYHLICENTNEGPSCTGTIPKSMLYSCIISFFIGVFNFFHVDMMVSSSSQDCILRHVSEESADIYNFGNYFPLNCNYLKIDQIEALKEYCIQIILIRCFPVSIFVSKFVWKNSGNKHYLQLLLLSQF